MPDTIAQGGSVMVQQRFSPIAGRVFSQTLAICIFFITTLPIFAHSDPTTAWSEPLYTILDEMSVEAAAFSPATAEAIDQYIINRFVISGPIATLAAGHALHDESDVLDNAASLQDLLNRRNDAGSQLLKVLRDQGGFTPDGSSEEGRGKFLVHLARVMPLLRPDISPSADFWPALQRDADASQFIDLTLASSPSELASMLNSIPALRLYTRVLANQGTSQNSLGRFIERPVERIFRGDISAFAADVAADAEYCYYRNMRLRFTLFLERNPDERWRGYLEGLLRIEDEIASEIPESMTSAQIEDLFFVDGGGYPLLSEKAVTDGLYWTVLGLVENPFFLPSEGRAVQIEAIQRNFGVGLSAALDFPLYLLAAVPQHDGTVRFVENSVESGSFHSYTLAIHDSGEDEDIINRWSYVTKLVETPDAFDFWYMQSGLFPVEVSSIELERDNPLFALDALLHALETVPGGNSGIMSTNPEGFLLIQLRKLNMMADSVMLLRSEDSAVFDAFPLNLLVWSYLIQDLRAFVLDGGSVDVATALTELEGLLNVESPAAELHRIFLEESE